MTHIFASNGPLATLRRGKERQSWHYYQTRVQTHEWCRFRIRGRGMIQSNHTCFQSKPRSSHNQDLLEVTRVIWLQSYCCAQYIKLVIAQHYPSTQTCPNGGDCGIIGLTAELRNAGTGFHAKPTGLIKKKTTKTLFILPLHAPYICRSTTSLERAVSRSPLAKCFLSLGQYPHMLYPSTSSTGGSRFSSSITPCLQRPNL
jgi:hypothetical protein